MAVVDIKRDLARQLANHLPVCHEEEAYEGDPHEGGNGDLISLCDIVITAMESEWTHWRTRFYEPKNSGVGNDPWAIIERLDKKAPPIFLTQQVVRQAVEDYAYSRLVRGMAWDQVQMLVDGSYTDAPIADSIIQFAVYKEEVYA